MLRGTKTNRLLGSAAIAILAISIAAAQQSKTTGPYTAEQASVGRALYQTNCASCHLPDLRGAFEAPPLAGANFMNVWRTRTTQSLLNVIQATMPLGNPRSLTDQDSAKIVAYILQFNGAQPGSQELTPAMTVTIGDVATGDVSTQPQSVAAEETSLGRSPGGIVGLTVTGEVKNYVPVTDEMLRHPDPNDWLMIRGNYPAWSHSPLTQITKDNVHQSPAGMGLGDE